MEALRNIGINTLINGTPLRNIPLNTTVEGVSLRNIPLNTTINDEPPAEEGDYPARMEFRTYSFTGGSGTGHLVFLIPEGYDDPANASKTYMCNFWWPGDGEDGIGALSTNVPVTMSGTTGTVVCGNTRPIGWGTLVVRSEANGTIIARGRKDGTIKGPGVNGVMTNHAASGGGTTVTLEFDEAPATTPVIDFYQSQIFRQGLPLQINQGDDLEGKIITCMVHNTYNDAFPNLVYHYDDPRAVALANYRIDTNRMGITGLSRGGYFSHTVMINRHAELAFWITAGAGSMGNTPWASMYDKGMLWVNGQNDEHNNNSLFPDQIGGSSHPFFRYFPIVINLEGLGHVNALWNDNTFKRSTAPVDWLKFASKFSLDTNEQAERHVEFAEETKDVDDYRMAKRAVSFLPSGSLKTSLEARVESLRQEITGTGKRVYIDLGSGSVDSSAGMNNLTNASAGQHLTNLKDETGVTTSFGLQIVDSVGGLGFGSRAACAGWGFHRDNMRDYAVIDPQTSGLWRLTGLNPAKQYRVSFYCTMSGTTDVTSRTQVTINSVTKSVFTAHTNRSKIVFDNLTPDGSGQINMTIANPEDNPTAINVIMIEEKS